MKTNKLCLGTVQFGLDYGINNPAGKPAREDSLAMLDMAVESGIRYIDTATAYGTAEELLGEWGAAQKNVKIISKLKPNLIGDDCPDPVKAVEDEITGSMKRMKLEFLDGYLLHTPENFYNNRIMDGLHKCKEKGLISNLGVSIYETEHALDVVKSGTVDYIQIPYSIFDQRLDKTDFFSIAKKNNVTVFARSAFLQGLILMEESRIPEHLEIAKKYLNDFDKIINRYGLSRIEAAFLFSFKHPDIDFFVFGVDNMQQLVNDIDLSKKKFDFDACRNELSNNFQNISKSIIFPSLWNKKKN